MDVSCIRCKTEYEFDDALISERGTNVKCTHCGYQFRIFPELGRASPEVWLVHGRGEPRVFQALRQLQEAIAAGELGPADMLSRGSEPARPLGSIAELQSLFAPAAAAAGAPHLSGKSERPRRHTRPLGTPSHPELEQLTSRAGVNAASSAPPARESFDSFSSLAPLRSVRDSFPDEEPLEARYQNRSRRAQSRWIVGVVFAGVLGLFAATVGRKYLATYTTSSGPAERDRDARIVPLLERGVRLLDEGDIEGAKESFDKASGLSEADPEVLVGLARVLVVKADLAWLRVLLIDPQDTPALEGARRELAQRLEQATQAVERASKVARGNPALQRARVDLERISGRASYARRLVGPIAASAHLPQNAYVLGALDLADATPVWASVIDRLRAATSMETELGRSTIALVYALVRSGAAAQAQNELDKLRDQGVVSRMPELDRFVQRHAAAVDAATTSDPPSPSSALDARAQGSTASGAAGLPSAPSDFRMQLREASKALARGDFDRAESLYQGVLTTQPGNTEALAGLGDVAERKNDPGTAASMYDRVLESNPTYVPALIARADLKWAAGDRAGAILLYRRVLEQVGPDSSYGRRAQRRVSAESTADGEASATPNDEEDFGQEEPSENQ